MEIHYAKTAKKMDMKKLKQSMWHLLTEFSTQADTEVTGSTCPLGAPCGGGEGSQQCLQMQDPELTQKAALRNGGHHT